MCAVGVQSDPSAVSERPRSAAGGWLVGPWFDALFVANIAWPLLVLAQVGEGFAGQAGLQFWQLYYITTPHRWITLALVFLDRQRFQQRPGLFVGIAAAVSLGCLSVRFTTGALTCLLAIDYLWNAWHFAAQHHGIYRIYCRRGETEPARSGLASPAWEKWALRGFLLYVILRVASATWSDPVLDERLRACDWVAAIVPLGLVAHDLARWRSPISGRVLYLVSMSGLYLALLWAVHAHRVGLVLSLATASALFHAIENLTLVSWTVKQRHTAMGSQLGLIAHLAPRWAVALGVFIVVLGAGGWLMDQRFVEAWLGINVVVAFLHYAYDGLIWRRSAK